MVRRTLTFLERVAGMRCSLADDRDGGGSDTKELRIGISDADPHRKSRREVDPIQGAIDCWQAVSDGSILRKYTPANALDYPIEAASWMLHQVNLHPHPRPDVFQLRLAVAGEYPPSARIDESKHRRPGACVRAL